MKQRYWSHAKQYVWAGSACHVGMLERHGYVVRDFVCGFHIGALQVQSPWRLTFSWCLENGRTTTLALGTRHVVPLVHDFSRRGRDGVLVQLPTVL